MTHQDPGSQNLTEQFIATYFSDASPEEVEQHVADFQRFAKVMTRIANRLAREDEESEKRAEFDSSTVDQDNISA
jgi:hypothetical protein